MKIIIPGGTGQVGTVLARAFHERGDEVIVLSRNAQGAPWRVVKWDAKTLGDWTAELEGAEVVINDKANDEAMLEIGAFLLRTETELILKSRRVAPGRLRDAGFVFQFPTWPEAAQDLCSRCRKASATAE